MNNIETGSHGENEMDPWERFARHGDTEKAPPWVSGRGRRRAPGRITWRGMLATLGVTALAVGSCGTPAPAARFVAPAPIVAPVTTDWSNPVPRVTPASQRRIEIVDRIKPASWKVGAAAEWLDRYTASDMVVVARCTGRAWKCVTVRGGKLSGNKLAVADSRTVTVDTAKVNRRGYRSDSARKRILAHELAHTFGLGHSSGQNLMAPTIGKVSLTLTSRQRAYLRTR